MTQLINLEGKRFGQVIVRGRASIPENLKSVATFWKCLCDCGNTCVVQGRYLTSGKTKSCGCLHRKITSERSMIHGKTSAGKIHKVYSIYHSMLQRVRNPNCESYPYYGGRGIKVCERWLGKEGFTNFLSDMGTPGVGLTLERINVNGDYSHDNCMWASYSHQNKNKRNTRIYEANGESLCLSDWAKRAGISLQAMRRRIELWNDLEKALTTRKIK